MSARPAPTPERDRIPLFQKLMFATGENMNFVCTGLMTSVLWMLFFNIGLGLKPYVLGIILTIYRAWDAITDPVSSAPSSPPRCIRFSGTCRRRSPIRPRSRGCSAWGSSTSPATRSGRCPTTASSSSSRPTTMNPPASPLRLPHPAV